MVWCVDTATELVDIVSTMSVHGYAVDAVDPYAVVAVFRTFMPPEAHVRDYFEDYGDVASVVRGSLPRSYVITFLSKLGSLACLAKGHLHEISYRQCDVCPVVVPSFQDIPRPYSPARLAGVPCC